MTSQTEQEEEANLIHWPFVIVGTLAMLTSLMFMPLLMLPLRMPVDIEEQSEKISENLDAEPEKFQNLKCLFCCFLYEV